MSTFSLDHLRSLYLDFYQARGHAIIPSAPLVPENDPTTLFTSSGMQPLLPYFLGQPHSKGKRVVNSQKCFRANDIEEVGDNRHTTYFEMIGNWSFGDYFKKEQLPWVFEFLTKEVGLDPKKIFVTVFAGSPELGVPRDDESVSIWKEIFSSVGIEAEVVEDAETKGMQSGRIFFYPEKKNWWSRSGVPAAMPAGEPGGPDSELFFDFGVEYNLHENSQWKNEPCHVNCDCGRFVEIGNSVFMQYKKQDDGSFVELPQMNVDFGGGLERILAAAHGNPDVFTTPPFAPIIHTLEAITNTSYSDETLKRSYRVIADHMRAAVMLIADGVLPDNKEQGYFVRRLIRRSVRYGQMMGVEGLFLGRLVPDVVALYATVYPQVKAQEAHIIEAVTNEEQKFAKALRKGLIELEKLTEITGKTAFWLYETYGFPFELTQEIAAEKGVTLKQSDFDVAREEHSASSRTASAGKFKGGLADHSDTAVKYHTATHLLHAALRKVLGETVQQKGSNITTERLRFDFNFDRALTEAEKQEIQALITGWIAQDLPVSRKMMEKQAALKSGATAFFIEKYPDEVSVYTIGKDAETDWISKEFCGGPHVSHTGEIGTIHLTKEQSAGSNLRRIYMELG